MSVAYLPSPSRGVWHLGPVPVRAYALCIVLGVIVAVWITGRRYRAAGGEPGVVVDVATWAVPFGLVGARLYSVLTDYELYFAGHRDWANVLKVWDGGLGIWFNQELYGRPSTLPWALRISPAHRLPGYESFATFQPAFLYEAVWDLLTAVVVIWATRRSHLTGGRAFALYVALYSAGMFVIQSIRIDPSHHFAGLRINQWAALAGLAIALVYLRRTRPARRDMGRGQPLAHPASATPNPS